MKATIKTIGWIIIAIILAAVILPIAFVGYICYHLFGVVRNAFPILLFVAGMLAPTIYVASHWTDFLALDPFAVGAFLVPSVYWYIMKLKGKTNVPWPVVLSIYSVILIIVVSIAARG